MNQNEDLCEIHHPHPDKVQDALLHRLVKFRKEGKEAWYSLDDDHVVKLINQGLEHVRES